jgi:hypothetical protein
VAIDGSQLAEGSSSCPRVDRDRRPVPTGSRRTRPRPPSFAIASSRCRRSSATVLGVPVRRPDGTTLLTAGLGRPLVLSTVEPTEAMQLLAGGRRGATDRRDRAPGGRVGPPGPGLGWAAIRAIAAVVTRPPPGRHAGPDRRQRRRHAQRGRGPGLVGSPLLAIGIVSSSGSSRSRPRWSSD